jgi:hypothetical protein
MKLHPSKKNQRRLVLSKETLRSLSPTELGRAGGQRAGTGATCVNSDCTMTSDRCTGSGMFTCA